jgi:hypothetical protein
MPVLLVLVLMPVPVLVLLVGKPIGGLAPASCCWMGRFLAEAHRE